MSYFLLELSVGVGWVVTSTPEANSFLLEFASILHLKPIKPNEKNTYPRIIFFRLKQDKCALSLLNDSRSKLADDCFSSTWKVQDLSVLRRWLNDKSFDDILIELGNDNHPELEIIRMWTALYIVSQRIQRSGGLLFHSALVEYKGKGFLLVGTGGIGKSTACKRLPPDWTPLSDDQVLIILDVKNGCYAHPVPTWSDYILKRKGGISHPFSLNVPLQAIFFLEQAESDDIIPISKKQTILLLNQSVSEIYRPYLRKLCPEEKRITRTELFHKSYELALKIPAYILKNSLHGKFWEKIAGVI